MPILLPPEAYARPNLHRDKLRAMIDAGADTPKSHLKNYDFLFLCFTNRCGSHLLAELLATTERFNLAGEFFNFDTVTNHATKRGFTEFGQYFDYLCETLAVQGRLTCKLAIAHLVVLHEAGILEEIHERSRFVCIQRNDKLAQAISLVIANQTGRWTSYVQPRSDGGEAVYSADRIWQNIRNICQQQTCFDFFFALNGIKQYTMVYEQFSVKPESCLQDMTRWLGLDSVRLDPAKIRVQRQASEKNLEWRELFLKHAGVLKQERKPTARGKNP